MRTVDNPAESASAALVEHGISAGTGASAPRRSLSEAMRQAHERKRALGLPWKGTNKKAKAKAERGRKPGKKVARRGGGPGQSREEIEAFRDSMRPLIHTHSGVEIAQKLGRPVSTVAYHLAALRKEAAEGSSKAVARGRPSAFEELRSGGEALQRGLQHFINANRLNYQKVWAENREMTEAELEVALGVKRIVGDDPQMSG